MRAWAAQPVQRLAPFAALLRAAAAGGAARAADRFCAHGLVILRLGDCAICGARPCERGQNDRVREKKRFGARTLKPRVESCFLVWKVQGFIWKAERFDFDLSFCHMVRGHHCFHTERSVGQAEAPTGG